MKQNKVNSYLFLFLSILAFSLSFPIMLTVFQIPNPKLIVIPIILMSLIAFFIKRYRFKLPLYFLILFFSAYFSNHSAEKTSLLFFIKKEYHVIQKVIFLRDIDYTPLTSYLLFLMFLLLLVELQFVFKKVFLVGFVCVGYLMLLTVFNDINVALNAVLIGLITLLLPVLIRKTNLSPKLLGSVMCVLIMIGLAVIFLPRSDVEKELFEVSAPFRGFLTKKGVYRFIANKASANYKKTGFSEDDTKLGGAITDDYELQFKVRQDNPHYWKIDNKSVYTGRGWEKATEEVQDNNHFYEEVTFYTDTTSDSEPEDIDMIILYDEGYVPTTYGNLSISDVNKTFTFNKNEKTNRVTMKGVGENKTLTLKLSPLDYEENEIKKATAKIDTSDIDYLQLPEELPETIKTLAIELTEDKTNDYDKVKAIETYLRTNKNLRYSKEDASYPDEDEDYVEDFLFDSNVGYCDNFSTTMAILLRTIGIPTRWAKGFNAGSVYGVDDGKDVYAIRNSNAHSWVEVYFEGYGWLPFEPTPSFIYPDKTKTSLTSESSITANSYQDSNTSPETESSEVSRSSSYLEEKPDETSSQEVVNKKIRNSFIIIVSLMLICLIILLSRYWLLGLMLMKVNAPRFSFSKTYPLLLKRAEKKMPRRKEQDLMTYATNFEEKFPQFYPDFSHLTSLYEKAIYGNDNAFTDDDKNEMKKVMILLYKK